MSSIDKQKGGHGKPWRGVSLALAGLAWLGMGLRANAQVSVDTIGGGVRAEGGPASGFVGGNTWTTAQFNAPYSCALDTNGNLWIADKNNSDIEQVSQAGNKASSITTECYITKGATHNFHAFANVIGVAVDPANNLYVLTPSPPVVQKYSLSGESTSLNLLSSLQLTGAPSAAAMAVDANSNVFLAFANGVIIRFPLLDSNPPPANYSESYTLGASAQVHYIVTSFGWNPAGLALRPDGRLAVSDTLNNAIWVVSTNDYTSNAGPQLVTGYNGEGYDDGGPAYARFDQPTGLAASADGRLIVCDKMNNRLRVIDTSSNTTTLYGTASNVWTATCTNCDPTLYAGWVDGVAGTTRTNASGRLPVSVAISPSGSLFVTETYYSLIREVTNATFAPVNLSGAPAMATAGAATGITSTNATFNGTVNPGGETTSYYFEYGTTTNYGSFTTTNVLTTGLTSSQPVSLTLSNLAPNTIYHFQLVAFNGFSPSFGGDQTLLTQAEAPVVATEPATGITFNSATLQAIVNPQYAQTEVTFQWGTTTNLGNTTTPISLTSNLAANANVSFTISNLQSSTTYYFLAAANSAGGTADGAQQVFSTPSGGVVTLPPTNVTASSATLQATVNPGGTPASVYFQWGTTTNFGSNTPTNSLTSNLTSTQAFASTIGPLQAGTTYYYEAVAVNIGGTIDGNEVSLVTSNLPAPTLSFSPSNGYFPECVAIYVTSSSQSVYYTTDGSTPTTNSAQVQGLATNSSSQGLYVGSIEWCQPLLNVSALHLLAVSGSNAASMTLLQGGFPPTNSIGFPQPLAGAPGSHLYIPVVVELQSNVTLESLQFRVEINTNQGGTPNIASIDLQPLTANDFVPLPGPAPGNAPVTFGTFPYTTSSNGQGLVITAEGGSSGLDMTGSGVVVMLHLQIPTTGTYGQSYSLSVLDASGTSDGQQANVGLAVLPTQTLSNTYTPYTVGDSSPSTGYNAEQFGIKGTLENAQGSVEEVGLDNADVNNAIYASVGIRVPPSDSDVFNAMDAYPPDSAGHGGDGVIQFLDWETILGRSLGVSLYLGMDTNNYLRFWTNGDISYPSHSIFDWEVGTLAPLPVDSYPPPLAPSLTPLALTTSPPGMVWFCEASIGSGTIMDALPGNTYSLPVYVNVLPGYSLAGMQFRAIVTGGSGAPAVTSIQFNPAGGVPSPQVLPGLAGNDKVQAWSLGSFATPLQNSNYLGTISFEVPLGADPGVCYTLHFSGVDGAPNFSMDYQMESHPGCVWVMSSNLQPASITSDEWKLAFFGSLTNSQAGDNVDADGDGALNWQEYLAGTNPTNASSRLQFSSASLDANGVSGVAINWLTAPGKTYILQSSPVLNSANWTPINTNSGDGNNYECIVTNLSGNSHFYQIRLQP